MSNQEKKTFEECLASPVAKAFYREQKDRIEWAFIAGKSEALAACADEEAVGVRYQYDKDFIEACGRACRTAVDLDRIWVELHGMPFEQAAIK